MCVCVHFDQLAKSVRNAIKVLSAAGQVNESQQTRMNILSIYIYISIYIMVGIKQVFETRFPTYRALVYALLSRFKLVYSFPSNTLHVRLFISQLYNMPIKIAIK